MTDHQTTLGTTADQPSRPGDPTPAAIRDGSPAAPATAPPTAPPTSAPAPGRDAAQRGVPRTRTGSLWVGLIAAAAVFILLLVFILQNSHTVEINFMGMHGHLSLAVALLLATASGMLLVAIPGTVRIMQLRRGIRRRGDVRAPRA